MNIWIVSMECAGIQEAGGVKNVTLSLAKEFSACKNNVTLFLPRFKCTTLKNIENFEEKVLKSSEIDICNKKINVNYSKGFIKNTKVKVVFVEHECFSEKDDIYVYSKNEELKNPEHKRQTGHIDVNLLDVLFQKAVVQYSELISSKKIPDIIHAHDASCACIGAFVNQKKVLNNTKTFVTIHNAGPFYHHEFKNLDEAKYFTQLSDEILSFALNGERVEPYLIASEFSKLITVSDFYAEEITNPLNSQNTDGLSKLFYEKNIKIQGITNGIDFNNYNPAVKKRSFLPFAYNPLKLKLKGKSKCRLFLHEYCAESVAEPEKYYDYTKKLVRHGFLSPISKNEILLSFHGRTVYQKGITILEGACEILLKKYDNMKIIVVGQGDKENVLNLIQFTQKFPGKAVYFEGYNKLTSRLCVAAGDFIILPSFFEPCCLEDFIAQIFGSIPIAHKTGGLRKIIDNKTGFLYEENTPENLSKVIETIIESFTLFPEKKLQMIKDAAVNVKENYSWKKIVKEYYLPLFNENKNIKKN